MVGKNIVIVEESVSPFNLTACISGIVGVIVFITLVIACRRKCSSKPQTETEVAYNVNNDTGD